MITICGELKRDSRKLKDALKALGNVTFEDYARPGYPTPTLRLAPADVKTEYELVSRVWGWGTQNREGLPPAVGTYNTRIETWKDPHSVWRLNATERLLLPTEYFREGTAYFKSSNDEILWLVGIGNGKEVSVFTQPANDQVKPWHGRMPIFTTTPHVNRWLKEDRLDFDVPHLKIVA